MATRKKTARPAKTGDQHAAEELVLYIDNTSDLSLQGPSGQGRSVALNAMRRFRKGTYNPELAVKLFGYLVESGAKRYAKEMGSGPWSEMFDVATRRLAAEQLEEDFRRMAKGGELNHLEGMKESRGIVSENEPFVRGFNHAIDLWNAGTTWESISNRSEYDASPRGRGMYAAIQAMSGWVDDAEREAQAFGFSRDEARRLIEDGLRKSRGGREAGERGGAREARGVVRATAGRAKPWRTNPLLPGVDQLATAVARLSRNLERSPDGEIDLRLQVFPDGGWELHYGDSGWDPDHSGSWGASSIPGGTIPFDEAHRIADDLLQQVDEQMAENEDLEEKPKRTLPPGRNLRASQGIVRSKGKR